MQARTAQGYRLMVLNTNDKDYAFKVRAELLQRFPEQKPYMWFANPYIRIKFGNFRTKEEADVYKKQISKMLNGSSIYYLHETIEVVPDKDFNPDDMRWVFFFFSQFLNLWPYKNSYFRLLIYNKKIFPSKIFLLLVN